MCHVYTMMLSIMPFNLYMLSWYPHTTTTIYYNIYKIIYLLFVLDNSKLVIYYKGFISSAHRIWGQSLPFSPPGNKGQFIRRVKLILRSISRSRPRIIRVIFLTRRYTTDRNKEHPNNGIWLALCRFRRTTHIIA